MGKAVTRAVRLARAYGGSSVMGIPEPIPQLHASQPNIPGVPGIAPTKDKPAPIPGPHDHVGTATKVHVGPIKSSVAGRTDHLPIHVPSGSYVIPADIIGAMGEGNTLAGFKVARSIFEQPFYGSSKAGEGKPYHQGTEPYGEHGKPYHASAAPYGQAMPGRKDGGAAPSVPIVAAGGEYVIHPSDVVRIGHGDLDDGHRILDAFVLGMRAKTVKTLKGLPGPKKD